MVSTWLKRSVSICFNKVTTVFQQCFNIFSMMFQQCFNKVSTRLQQCVNIFSMMFQQGFNTVPTRFQQCFKTWQCFKNVSICFKMFYPFVIYVVCWTIPCLWRIFDDVFFQFAMLLGGKGIAKPWPFKGWKRILFIGIPDCLHFFYNDNIWRAICV